MQLVTPATAKILQEYRCPNCHKLLCKGFLTGAETAVEVKCRGCAQICTFHGEDALIISRRSVLIREGLLPDTDTDTD